MLSTHFPALPFDTAETVWMVVAGILLLIVGRRLAWLSLALLGFWVGIELAVRFAAGAPWWLQLSAAALLGLLTAGLALLLVRVAVAVAGFFLGGYGLIVILDSSYPLHEFATWQWLVVVAGAVVAAILAGLLFDVALVLLTAGVGALLLIRASPLDGPPAAILFVVLAVVGTAIQVRRPRRRPADEKPSIVLAQHPRR